MRQFFAGARSVPVTSWRAPSQWRCSRRTYLILLLGLYLYGTGDAIIINATLGAGPWVVFALGVTHVTGLSIAFTTCILSVFAVLCWIPLRQKPGLGTISNAVVISIAIGVGTTVIPEPSNLYVRIGMVILGILSIAVASALYLTCGLGAGPRDGLMTGINKRFGVPVGRARLVVELTVVSLGWLLSGMPRDGSLGLGKNVGLGTVLFALLIGRCVAITLGFVGRRA